MWFIFLWSLAQSKQSLRLRTRGSQEPHWDKVQWWVNHVLWTTKENPAERRIFSLLLQLLWKQLYFKVSWIQLWVSSFLYGIPVSNTVRKRNYLTKMLCTWWYFYDANFTNISIQNIAKIVLWSIEHCSSNRVTLVVKLLRFLNVVSL